MTARKISLKVVAATSSGLVLDAPPILKEVDQSVDYICGHCGTILLHAEENRVHSIIIHCGNCGSYNSIDFLKKLIRPARTTVLVAQLAWDARRRQL